MKFKKNENLALIIGFSLIIFVIIFTIFRNSFSFTSRKSTQETTIPLDNVLSVPSYTTISAPDLNKKIIGIGKKENITLLDIRSFDSYITSHIVDAINIAIDEFPVGSKIDNHNLIIIIGENSADADIVSAIDELKQEDFKNIVVLAGGMDSWNQLIGGSVTYGNPKSIIDQSKVSYLDPSSLNDALKQEVPVFIIDVRSNKEYVDGHINGAKNIPFEELEQKRNEITEKRVVVVGANELQEFQAAVQIHDMLLISPFVMRTAMPGWVAQNFPLVK